MSARIYKGGEYLVAEATCDEIFTPEEFTDEQKQIAETTEQFVANEILPHLEENDSIRLCRYGHGVHLSGPADGEWRTGQRPP